MSSDHTTCWAMIRDASEGDRAARDAFAAHYEPTARAYLEARWRGSVRQQDLADALQDVFIECFRDGGVLGKIQTNPPTEFRPFFFGIVRNIARRYEQRPQRQRTQQPDTEFLAQHQAPDEERLTRIFDRAWALSVMQQAADRHRQLAADDESARKRVELLELRFSEGLAIRDIASRWNQPAESVHREYARARQEFERALHAVVAFLHPGANEGEVQRTARELLSMLR